MQGTDQSYDHDYGPAEPPKEPFPWDAVRLGAAVAAGGALLIVGSLLIWSWVTADPPNEAQPVLAEANDVPLEIRPSIVIDPETAGAEASRQENSPKDEVAQPTPSEDVAALTEALDKTPPIETTIALAEVEGAAEDEGAGATPPPDAPAETPVALATEAEPTKTETAQGQTEDMQGIAESDDNVQQASGSENIFQDCPECPAMVTLEGGVFFMGSPPNEEGRYGYEGPRHEVTLKPFAIGQREVTFDEWDACVSDGGCGGYKGRDQGWGRGGRPALGVSWRDASAYARWLSKKTGRAYRLPSEAEWEYAARGGTQTAYWWGADFDKDKLPTKATREVSELPLNPFGLAGMLGNAREWVEDCYEPSYERAPKDGRPAISGNCNLRVIRGGSWKSEPRDMRAANRARIEAKTRSGYMGFRVAATLD